MSPAGTAGNGSSAPRSAQEKFLRSMLWLMLLAFVFVLGDRAASSLVQKALRHSGFRFARIYRGGLPRGILVLGHSRGVSAVFPPGAAGLLHEPVYNLSFNGVSTEVDEALLRDYLDHNSAPRLVMIEVTNIATDNHIVSETKTFGGLSPRLDSLYARVHPTAARSLRIAHLFRYNSELFLRTAYYFKKSDQGLTNRSLISDRLLRNTNEEPAWSLEALEPNVSALARMVRTLRERGIEVRLFIAPYLPAHAKRLTNLDAVKRLIDSAVGQPNSVWDYSQAIGESERFADRIHLNFRGAEPLLIKMMSDDLFISGAVPGPPVRR